MDADNASFNIPALKAQLLERLGPRAADYPQHIEQHYPRILAKLVELWDTDQLEPYLKQLVFTERSGRQGFPDAVAVELFHINAAIQALGLSREPPGFGWNAISLETREADQPARS
jgi:hypothetical protein